MDLFLYNTLTRGKEVFSPIHPGSVGLYTCGPTVYNYAHIGNLRAYLFEDILKRVLVYNGFKVKHVMNITDVGHLTGDRDMGEDKMEAGAQREGRTAWDIAEHYTRAFKEDLVRLNIVDPTIWCKATDTIPEQIALIETLEEKGFTYRIILQKHGVSSYLTFSPLPAQERKHSERAVYFCGTFPINSRENLSERTAAVSCFFALWSSDFPLR